MGILKRGSKGNSVKILQQFLGIKADGDFGRKTEIAVKNFQKKSGLKADGIVGSVTWKYLEIATTDNSERAFKTSTGLLIKSHYMDQDQYSDEMTDKEYLFIHDTAGWNNPYNQIHGWNTDNRGIVGTEFIVGGQNVRNNNKKYDGEVLQAFPEGYYGWHLGKNGSQKMHTNSVGIELCNFGWIKNGRTWSGAKANDKQIVTLNQEFRGFKTYHRFSNKQIENTQGLILYIANRDNIDVRDGLPRLIKKIGVKAFEFNSDAYYGRIKGLLTHTNTRKDKFDCHPQQELIDMLLSL